MTKLCLLLGVCLAYAMVVTAQVCPKDSINGLIKCEEENLKKGMEEKFKLEKAERQCFVDGKCKNFDIEKELEKIVKEEMEKLEEEHQGSGHHEDHHEHSGHHEGSGHHKHEETEAEKEERNKTMHCFEEIFRSEHKKLSDCVEKESNGYQLPKAPEHPDHRRGRPRQQHRRPEEHKEGERKEGEQKEGSAHVPTAAEIAEMKQRAAAFEQAVKAAFEARLAKACEASPAAVPALTTCLDNITKTAMAKAKPFCDERKTCFEAAKCDKKSIEETFKTVVEPAVFKCIKDDGKPNFQQLAQAFPAQCGGVDFAKLEEHHKQRGGPGGKPHPKGKEGSGHHFEFSGHHEMSGHHEFSGHHFSGHHFSGHHEFSGHHFSGHHEFSGHHFSGFGSGHPKFPPHKEGEHGEHGKEEHEDPIEKICMMVEEAEKAKPAPKAA